jgi:hypothetical protein
MAELRKMKINLGDDLQTNYGQVKRDSVQSSVHAGPQAMEEYEVQYDPNNDFAIFGIGDPTRGGIQTMKEKMNLADGVKEADSSSDEDDHSVRRKDSKLSTKVNTGSNGLTGARTGSGGSSQGSSAKMMNIEDLD